jgi:hypothetical protein
MQIVHYNDFDTTIFEDESQPIQLVSDGMPTKFWVYPKYWREYTQACRDYENSEEYKKLEYELWFGKDDTNRD